MNKKSILDYKEIKEKNLKSKMFAEIVRDSFDKIDENSIPFVAADNISTRGVLTRCSSKMLDGYVPPFDATVIEKLLKNNGVLIGKTNEREFGVGDSENNFGTFEAVSSLENIVGITSDSSGNLHEGAKKFNLFGYKPTYGLVSRYGLISISSSIDTVSIVSEKFSKIPEIMNIISGDDGKDSTVIDNNEDYEELFDMAIGEEKIANLGVKNEELDDLNLDIKSIEAKNLKYAKSVYEIISSGEFASNMEKFDGVGFGYTSENYKNIDELYKNSRTEGMGAEVKSKILLGNFVLSSGQYEKYYVQAMKMRTVIAEEIDKIFNDFDIIISPIEKDFSIFFNLAGLPVVSMPLYGGILVASKAFNDIECLSFCEKLAGGEIDE